MCSNNDFFFIPDSTGCKCIGNSEIWQSARVSRTVCASLYSNAYAMQQQNKKKSTKKNQTKSNTHGMVLRERKQAAFCGRCCCIIFFIALIRFRRIFFYTLSVDDRWNSSILQHFRNVRFHLTAQLPLYCVKRSISIINDYSANIGWLLLQQHQFLYVFECSIRNIQPALK